MHRSQSFVFALVCILYASLSSAQGVQSGTIRGAVRDNQGLAMPGVTVTAASPVLQGPRVVTTDNTGGFTFANLPPGSYAVKFDIAGFATVEQQTDVALGLTTEQNVTMRPAGVTESVNVVAQTPAPIATPVVGTNLKHDEVDALATPRTIQGIATLAPAVSENTPNGGQLAINGAFAWDNIFMINGVDINDNLFANAQNLFIEDAIEETQVLTSGVSAEYGRFSGGVINAITKSGGNIFSGSARLNFLNAAWSKETPYEVSNNITRPSKLQETYEGTFGGPFVKEKLWFFVAGRYAGVDTPQTLQQTAVQVVQNDVNKRGEIKLTGTFAQNQTIQGGYMNNARTVSNTSGLFSLVADQNSLITRSLPNWYYFTNYHGVIGSNMLVQAQYSQRHFEFSGDGSQASTNLVNSPFFSNSFSLVYNAPYFCACDPEQRNNKQITGSVTNYWALGGRHETKVGYEWFRSQRTGGNSQSGTQYVFNTDWAVGATGKPLLDPSGRLIPVFVPGDSSIDFYPAVVGAVLNIDNNSAYAQDHWAINAHLSADLGARYEHVRATSTGGILGVNNNRIVPRLSVGYDVQGNGNHVVHASYAQYSGRYNETQVGANSPVGNPADIFSVYQGPAGQGLNFAPGLNIANYPVNSDNASVTVPTANVFLSPNTKSALVHEFTGTYGVNINNGRGYAEASYIYRTTHNLIEDFISLAEGTTRVVYAGVDAGFVTNHVFQNTDLAHRNYSASVLQGRYRLSKAWTVNGQWTHEFKDNGNYTGEATNQPGATSLIGDYPQAFASEPQRFYPDGRLNDFEGNRLRAWTIYNIDMGRRGDVSLSGLWRLDQNGVFSYAALNQTISTTQRNLLRVAGYPDLPGRFTLYFSDRGANDFPTYSLLDFDVNYNIPVVGTVKPWLRFDVFNLFNNNKLISWNTTVRPDPTSPLDALGLRTGFVRGSLFGQATTPNNFPLAFGGQNGGRTFRVAVGVRF